VGGVLTLGGRALGHYFYGMHSPVVVMVAVLTGNCVNVFANWVLIFGNLGAPELGRLRGGAGHRHRHGLRAEPSRW
jgi:MATE family multidrug resistance protein